jgi:HEPN domain-containing protein
MDSSDITKEWLSIAEKDLDSAEYLKGMKPEPVEIICYHCQQAAEKYLKAFLTKNKAEIIKTHDLLFINNSCKSIDSSFDQIDNACLYLNDFSVNIRYPYPMDLGTADMEFALKHARVIKNFILNKIKRS